MRKVLGASVFSLVGLASGAFLKLVLIAIAIASPLAWYTLTKWMHGFTYKASLPWWLFVGSGLLTMGIALATISVQSIQAALVNPVKSLRNE